MVINRDAIREASEKVYGFDSEENRRRELSKNIIVDIKEMYASARVHEFETGRKYYYFLESVYDQKLNMVLADY